MDVCMPHSAQKAIDQLEISSHQQETEGRINIHIPRTGRFCKLCEEEIEREEHVMCRCSSFNPTKEKYATFYKFHHYLTNDGED